MSPLFALQRGAGGELKSVRVNEVRGKIHIRGKPIEGANYGRQTGRRDEPRKTRKSHGESHGIDPCNGCLPSLLADVGHRSFSEGEERGRGVSQKKGVKPAPFLLFQNTLYYFLTAVAGTAVDATSKADLSLNVV
jgi:hypothetical protein